MPWMYRWITHIHRHFAIKENTGFRGEPPSATPGATIPLKTEGFAPESVFTLEFARPRALLLPSYLMMGLTSWCGWRDDVVGMMVWMLTMTVARSAEVFKRYFFHNCYCNCTCNCHCYCDCFQWSNFFHVGPHRSPWKVLGREQRKTIEFPMCCQTKIVPDIFCSLLLGVLFVFVEFLDRWFYGWFVASYLVDLI